MWMDEIECSAIKSNNIRRAKELGMSFEEYLKFECSSKNNTNYNKYDASNFKKEIELRKNPIKHFFYTIFNKKK